MVSANNLPATELLLAKTSNAYPAPHKDLGPEYTSHYFKHPEEGRPPDGSSAGVGTCLWFGKGNGYKEKLPQEKRSFEQFKTALIILDLNPASLIWFAQVFS